MKTKKLLSFLVLTLALVLFGFSTTQVNAEEADPIVDEQPPVESTTEVFRIPFTKVVTGNNAPKQAFEFEAKYELPELDLSNNMNISAPIDSNLNLTVIEPLTITIPEIETDGENTYDGIIIVEGSLTDIEHLKDVGFTVKEKDTAVENWTYSTTEYFLRWEQLPGDVEGKWVVYDTADKQNSDDPYSQVNPVDEMSFTNTYTEPKKEEPIKIIENPKTGDSIIMYSILFVIALFGIITSVMINKRKNSVG